MAKASTTRKKSTKSDGAEPSTHDIWKGSISFGLVEIPVALVSAEKAGGIKLSYLDRRNFAPVGYKRFNKENQREVPWSEIVHGYEYEKGRFVALGKEEMKRANPNLTQTISIEKFVDASEIEPIYFDRPYYLEPLKRGSKSYALLRQTLEKTGRVGVARFAVRAKEHVVVVGVRDSALVLYILRYAHELRSPRALDNVGDGDVRVSPQEVKMAERLVEDMSGSFDPDEYQDEYHSDLMKVIRAKIQSGDIHGLAKPEKEAPRKESGESLDLMQLLKQSVEGAHSRSRAKPSRGVVQRRPAGARPVRRRRARSARVS